MKRIKRFNNLWTMGLILFCVILIVLYILKIFFPEFVIRIVEIPRIVKFGDYIDSHWWAYYLVNGAISYFTMFLYTCACCRIKALNVVECLLLFAITVLSYVIEKFLPNQLLAYNFCGYVVMPLIVAINRKIKDYKIFYSTVISFIVTTVAQSLSLAIRDISNLITYPNTATFLILAIDGTILDLFNSDYRRDVTCYWIAK